jgi:hypothetical protein
MNPVVASSISGISGEDASALQALCFEYAWRIDWGQSATIPDLFTPGAVWDGPWGVLRGRDELRRGWLERSRKTVLTRHLTTNTRFVRVTDDHVRGWNSFLVFMGEPGTSISMVPQFLNDNIDEYERQPDGRWLFRSRIVKKGFADPGSDLSKFGL